jgi:hypothetical protein
MAIAPRIQWNRLALTLGLIGLGVLIPQLGLPQAITGPLVNALLILTVETAGIGPAVLVGLTTPLSALAHGVLPLPLMVMIPFIGIANAVLSTIYGALRTRSRWLALAAGAVLKFAWLYGVTSWLIAYPLQIAISGAAQPVALPPALVSMMQWPQLVTALAGGLIFSGLQFGIDALGRRRPQS